VDLQPGDVPVWGIPNMLLKQQCTTTSYVGAYSGASARVASGLYYRFGGVRGHRVESTLLEEVDYFDRVEFPNGNDTLTITGIYSVKSAN
jgi:hypothetical protein